MAQNSSHSDLSLDTDKLRPAVFDFLNYREYLKTILNYLLESKRHFSLRGFARTAGFGSHSYLKMITDGKRNLSPASTSKLTHALKLAIKEARYFETLILYNQSQIELDKDRYFQDLLLLRPRVKMKGLEKDEFEYVTNTLFVTIRELSAIKGFQADPDWIAQRLMRPATPTQIRHALEVLQRLKLLVRDRSGNLKHSEKTLATPARIESLEIFNAHRTILSESKDLILTTPPEETEITSMTVPLAAKSLNKIFEILQHCREEIVTIINEEDKDFEKVFQINMQLFPVTKPVDSLKDQKK